MWSKCKALYEAHKRFRPALELLLLSALLILLVHNLHLRQIDPFRQSVTLSWHLPSGEVREQTLRRGTKLALPEGEQLEGYTFLGWRDAQGNLYCGGELRAYEDRAFAASYALALETQKHIAYLDTDSEGFFRPHSPLTRAEAAVMLYRLLDTSLVGSGSFADLPPEHPCHDAAATLKTLGILSGSHFHAEDPVTRGELLQMLAALYPPAQEDFSFTDLNADEAAYGAFCVALERSWLEPTEQAGADTPISRAQTAVLINRVLGRSDAIPEPQTQVGTIPDVSFHDESFRDIAEAAIAHEHSAQGEDFRWTESEPLPLLKPGLFFVGHRLHCIDEDGSPVIGRALGLLEFNESGEITSGLPELDSLLVEVLRAELAVPKVRDMDQLRVLFDYTINGFGYLRRNLYEPGETGWQAQEAYTMLSTGKGNCYCFAAVFGELARFLGFEAEIFSGTISGTSENPETGEILRNSRSPHAWVEIEAGDGWRIFDPEVAFTHLKDGNFNCFNRGEGFRKQFSYRIETADSSAEK